jgi:hypothetical protein
LAQVKEDFTVSEETVGVFISLGTAAVSAAGGVFMEKYLLSAALQPRTQTGEGCGDTGEPGFTGRDAHTQCEGGMGGRLKGGS